MNVSVQQLTVQSFPRTINLPDPSIRCLSYTPPTVLCASHTVYAIPFANPGMAPPATFTANTSAIHSLFASADNTLFLSAADSDRFINVFSVAEEKSIGALVAESDVKTIALHSDALLIAVTTDGAVEVFQAPFEPATTDAAAASRRRKTVTRKGDARVKIVRPDSTEQVSIADASLQGDDLVVAWAESGVNMQFEKIRWSSPEDGSLALSGLVELTRSKAAGIGSASGAVINGAKDMGKISVDQSRAVVIGGVDTQDVGMVDASDVSEDEEEQIDDASDDDDEEEEEEEDDEKEHEEPSFSEKFQALEVSSAAKTITSIALTTTTTSSSSALTKKEIQPPSAGSLTTVLTQALKTNDTALLESCLHTTDSSSILATVRRLNSTMAVSLLERLAERIARRPGRAGSLGVWVRWTLVAHGGYLVSLPDLMRTLSGLYSTLNTRAGALPRLLALQGRLDMLHAQVDLRKALRNSAEGGLGGDAAGDKGVLYVEGQERDSSSEDESDEEPEEVGMQGLQIEDASFIKGGGRAAGDDTEDEDMDNGVEGSSGEEEEEEEEDEDDEDGEEEEEEEVNGFLDIEASEASGEEEEDEVDYDDVDVQILDTDEEEEIAGSKPKSKLLQGRSRR